MLRERLDTYVALIRTPEDNIHLEVIQLLPYRMSLPVASCWLLSTCYRVIQSIGRRLEIANSGKIHKCPRL